MKIKLLAIFCALNFSVMAQNLVPNHGFEEYIYCPKQVAQLNLASGWYSPTTGTPDYLNKCDTLASSGTLYNIFGTQLPFKGGAYAGMYLAANIFHNREYLQIALLSPLEKGKSYNVSLQLSCAEVSKFYVDRVSMCFSKEKPKIKIFKKCIDTTIEEQQDCEIIQCENKLVLKIDSLLDDKDNWIKLEGTYQAQGGEKVLTIGLFEGDINEKKHSSYIEGYRQKLVSEGKDSDQITSLMRFAYAYYYIDDIRIEKTEFTHR